MQGLIRKAYRHKAPAATQGPAWHDRDWIAEPDMAEPASAGRQAQGWDVSGALWRRKWLIALVTTLTMAAFSTMILLAPNRYQATSAVIFQGDRPSAARGDEAMREPGFAADTLANEVEAILSEELLTQVVMTLGLDHDPALAGSSTSIASQLARAAKQVAGRVGAWVHENGQTGLDAPDPSSPQPPARETAEAVAALRKRLAVGPVGLSRVLRITAQAKDPALAAQIANATATAYIQRLADAKQAETSEAHRWIEQRLGELRARATQSALSYEAFRRANGLVRGKDGPVGQEQVTQVSLDLAKARQAQNEANTALAQAEGASGNAPGAELDQLAAASGSQLLSTLREQLAQANALLAERETTGGALMASVVAARAKVAALNRSIASERERILDTLRRRAGAAAATVRGLDAEFDALKQNASVLEESNARAQALERDANADQSVYADFLSRARLTDPQLNYQSPGARILSRAVVPLRPASPNKTVLLPAALVVSLGLGVTAGFVRDTRRKGIRSMRSLPGPPQGWLGMMPLVGRRSRRMARVFDEAAAQILARVTHARPSGAPASIVVTSALPREGKSRTALALASAARKRGLRVLLVDADLRTRSISTQARLLPCECNLVRLLRNEITVGGADDYNGLWNLSVLPAGTTDESPMLLWATDAWERALRSLETQFDLVVIDTPPVLLAGDTWLIARPADATIMVTRWGTTPRSAVDLAMEQLAVARVKLAGVVLTMVSHREHARYNYDDSVMFSPSLLRYHRGRRRAA